MAPSAPSETGIPHDLYALDRWVCWKEEIRDGKPTKVPKDAKSGGSASSTDPATWCDYDTAMAAVERRGWDGVGVVFTNDDDIMGIDLDDCVDEAGTLSDAAKGIVQAFGTYAEFSPSGTGVKLFFRGRKPTDKCTSRALEGIGKIEVYQTGRYFTVTGDRVAGAPIELRDCQDAFDALCAQLWPPEEERVRCQSPGFTGDDEALLDKARAAENGVKFRSLFDLGDTSGHGEDDSCADAALASLLAFWCGPDPERIERLFSASALGQREKWQRADYRERTIRFAVENATEFYAPGGRGRRGGSEWRSVPTIVLGTDEHRVIDEVVEALGDDPDVYQRGGVLVEPVEGEESLRIAVMEPARLRDIISRDAALVRITKDGETPAHPTDWLVKGVKSRHAWRAIRILRGIADAPVLRRDGSVFDARGYDPQTRVLLEPGTAFPPISHSPTREDAIAAAGRLLDLFCDFPLAGEEHRAALLAALLTPIARHAIDGPVPLFLIDANVRGAGKSLLARVIAIIATGREIPVSSYTHESEEARKQITTMLMQGDRMVLLDNLRGVLGNDALDRLLTGVSWRDRVLGTNSQVELPISMVLFATGNNTVVQADTARRIIHLRMDSPMENPEDRSGFKHEDLIGYVKENRAALYMDALAILAAYLQAGSATLGLRPYGSFEGWWVRHAVRWVGLPDPCETRQELEITADSDKESLEQLLDAWARFDPDGEGIVLAEALRRLYPSSGDRPSDEASEAMRAALESIAPPPRGGSPTARKLGARLKSIRGRVVGGRMINATGEKRSGGQVWRLVTQERRDGS